MPKYIAKQSIGHFMPGDEIKGLEDKKLQALLTSGAIEEAKAKEEPKADGTAARLVELEKANAELTKASTELAEQKAKAEQDLTAANQKAVELEKALSDAQAALKKAEAEAKKAAK
ncbi:hypothetical protein BS636_13525 [Acinetobacter sp. LoGeW2-3]|uniref:hypothetical protein n=1 Tax=Acinetobacter sp. LoGeW2-3 TaxID=1808001 RepID=UPI000C05922A|nr:hypothetical protein [Acinetobacter sp. LoGeW2-3]ATO20619.1 hypothetical protein BS636_13525 [Acinetobacter sp. LoGeW2-3]